MRKFIFYVVALILISFGISLLLETNIGAGSYDAFHYNLSKTIGLTIGTWLSISCVILVILSFFISKKLKLSALITSFINGALIDFWLMNVTSTFQINRWDLNLFLFLVGLSILSFGIALNIKSGYATSPFELLPLTISEKYNITFWKVKIGNELVIIILALFVGIVGGIGMGQVGIGTLVISFLIGPMINFYLNRMKEF